MSTSARGGSDLHRFAFSPEDSLLFGPESTGLPADVQSMAQEHVRIPVKDCIRSLNLSTSAGIILYMALASLNGLDDWPA